MIPVAPVPTPLLIPFLTRGPLDRLSLHSSAIVAASPHCFVAWRRRDSLNDMFSVSRVFSHLAKVRFCGGAARAPTASPSFLAVRRRVGWEDGHATRATVERRRVEDAEGWLGGSSEGDAGRRRPNSVHMSMTQPPLILEWLRFTELLSVVADPL
jgi:hypothetical protein